MQDRLVEKIRRLKEERNAVILAHNYQIGPVQDIADEVGDSLELARKAAAADADVIVFCGVHFMAETAHILAPDKTVLLPELDAGCPLADMATAEQVRQVRAEHPGAAVVCYVNSSAAVKAESDVACTSANAVKVVASLPEDQEVVFLPDKNLGSWVRKQLGRPMILWDGFCPSHVRIRPEDVEAGRRAHPDALVMVHPESPPEVVDLADEVLGTGGMCRLARQSEVRTFLVGTEVGLLHRLKKENPGKTFLPLTERAVCPNMKKITLESIARALERMDCRVTLPEELRKRAARAVERMVAIG